MKKFTFVIIFIVVLFFIPVICNADVGVPGITPYKVRVKNPNGIIMKSYNNKEKRVSYDTILEIRFEIRNNDKVCGLVLEENSPEEYIVDLSEVELIADEVDISGLEPQEPTTMYVYDEGAYLYKGPSKIYDKVDGNVMIPVGTTISFEYSDDMWAYVEYNGHKGWVYIFSMIDVSPYNEGSCLVSQPSDRNTSLYTLTDIYLTSSPRSTEKSGIVVPAFTEVTYKYYYNAHAHRQSFCIEYNGKEGWYEEEEYAIACNCKNRDINLITITDIPVYSTCRNTDSTVLTTIPKNTECDVIYVTSDEHDIETWCYVSYNGVEGWIQNLYEDPKICLDSNLYYFNYKIVEQYQALVDTELFTEIGGNTTGVTIPKESILSRKYYYYNNNNSENWCYVYNDTYEGWIKYNYYDWKFVDSQEINFESNNINEIKNINENDNKDNLNLINENTGEVEMSVSFKTIIIECIVGAVIIALLAIVAIKFVNKKKDN